MSTLRYSSGEYLAGSAIREMLEAVSDELVRRGYPAITVVSGTRLYEWQEAIFRARYVPATQVNGRRVYDFQWWNGVLWARISSAGRVAPPSPTAPHVANIAADIGAPYNSYGAARNAMLQVIRDLGLEGALVNNGTSFGEVWHWESRRGAGTVGRPASSTSTTPQEEDDMYDAEAEKRLLSAIDEKLDEVKRIAAPYRVFQWGTGHLLVNPRNGRFWIIPQGYGELLSHIGYRGGAVASLDDAQLGFVTGFLPAAVGDRDFDPDAVGALNEADISAIKKAIAENKVALTPDQMETLVAAVGESARAALEGVTFVVKAEQ